jgi:hypothetical protein
MPYTKRLLVLANRTVDSDELFADLLARAKEGPIVVTLLVPRVPEHGAGERLAQAIARLHDAGIEASGLLGDGDPCVAVEEVWDPRRYDEIVVATLPVGISRWLGSGLPNRVRRLTDAIVHRVEATERAPVQHARAG